MKTSIILAAALCIAAFTGCVGNQVPGLKFKRLDASVDANGVNHITIDQYDNKKDTTITVNPVTHALTISTANNPAVIDSTGSAAVNEIKATGEAAINLSAAIGTAAGTAVKAAAK